LKVDELSEVKGKSMPVVDSVPSAIPPCVIPPCRALRVQPRHVPPTVMCSYLETHWVVLTTDCFIFFFKSESLYCGLAADAQ
jgi:hypothetical protein